MAGWALGTFGVVGWPQGREGEGLDVVAIDFGRQPVIVAVVEGATLAARYIVARVRGHSTWESLGHQRYEPARLYVLAVGREPRPDYSCPVYEAQVVCSVAPGRQWAEVEDSLCRTAKALSMGRVSEAQVKARYNPTAEVAR